jgi:hypothetical protein
VATTTASALSTNVVQRVIVVLKDQVPQAPATRAQVATRTRIEAAEQKPILGELGQTRAGNVHSYTTINAVSATVSPAAEASLAANPAVAEVVPDQIIQLSNPFATSDTSDSASAGRVPLPGTCSNNTNAPELEPQAISAIGADSRAPGAKTARSLGIDGNGVKVAFIADGLDINNADFIRPDGSHVFVDYKDFSGEGTGVATGGEEAFLDASSIAAQGQQVYDIQDYSALPLSQHCYIQVEGVAPGASLVGLDISGADDAAFNSSLLQAIDYAVSVDHVNVLNESLGNNYYPDDQASLDLVKTADDGAVAAGVTVTVASGDAGVTNTVGTPASDPNVISAGASTTYEADSQVGIGGFQFAGLTGYLDNNISSFSSSGFEQDGSTLSLVAPGELNWALCSTDQKMYRECATLTGVPTQIQQSGGTSESAPLTAGAAALVIQAYGKTHNGAVPSPALVKQLLTSTAEDIQAPADLQGSGLIDAYRAVLAAESYNGPDPTGTPDTLLESASQFNSVSAGGGLNTFTENLTNLGSTPATVHLSSRTLGAYRTIDTSRVTLSDIASPKSVDYQGVTDNYETVQFYVPPGEARLNGSIAFQGSSSAPTARVRLSLITPTGQLADYSTPQGVGNYGDAQVANPAPGVWTAYIWSRDTAHGGTTGPVLFGASVAGWNSFGAVTPSVLTIAPRATKSLTLSVRTPQLPGDYAGSLVVASASQPPLAIPVTLRSLVPTGRAAFSGVLTGGNGRTTITGVTEYYQVDVPARARALNASLTLADNPDNQTYIWLIDPTGQAQAFQSNDLVTMESAGHLTATSTLAANAHVLAPAGGRWTIIVVFAPAVSGTAISEPFTLSVDQTPVPVNATGVPHGRSITVANPAVVRVRVTNTGTAPEAYFVDGRVDATVQYPLVSVTSPDATVPLKVGTNVPLYLVPPQTTDLQATAATSGTTPIQFDLRGPNGDPDSASGQGMAVSAALSGNPITTGLWGIVPDVVGPFGKTGAAPEAVSTTLTATTEAFDPAVGSVTGDLWQTAIGQAFTVSPVVVQPGQSANIAVVIAPQGTAGTTVSGVLYLDDDSLFSLGGRLTFDGDTIAAIPYSYRIGG